MGIGMERTEGHDLETEARKEERRTWMGQGDSNGVKEWPGKTLSQNLITRYN